MSLPRRRLVQFIAATVLLACGLLAPARSAWACTCRLPSGPDEAMSKAVAVFSGTVISIADLGAFTGLHSRNATLDMLDSWKGATETPITVATGYGSADCGYPFEIGNQYLVYAYEYQGALATNICWRTAELSQASADLAYLQTQPTETATPARPSVPVLWLGAAACGLLVLAAPAVVAWRRRAASPAH